MGDVVMLERPVLETPAAQPEKPKRRRWLRVRYALAGAIAYALTTAALGQQQDFDQVEIKTHKLADGIYMLEGAGGNIGVSAGADGVFLIDDQYAPLTDKIRAAVAEVSDQPIRFVFNTHWHFDHTGGNENFGKAGSLIVAHDNVRRRMSSEQVMAFFDRTVPPSPEAALPVVTFANSVSFHINGDTLQAFHVAPAHTDGDSVVLFKKANVIHTGDVFFNGHYPFIDTGSGGSVHGMLYAADRILTLTNDKTRIIPGHGPLATRKDLQRYRDMLDTVAARISILLNQGKTLKEVIAARPTKDFDKEWGDGFMKPDQWVTLLYHNLQQRNHTESIRGK